jgi:hypothetical protein
VGEELADGRLLIGHVEHDEGALVLRLGRVLKVLNVLRHNLAVDDEVALGSRGVGCRRRAMPQECGKHGCVMATATSGSGDWKACGALHSGVYTRAKPPSPSPLHHTCPSNMYEIM